MKGDIKLKKKIEFEKPELEKRYQEIIEKKKKRATKKQQHKQKAKMQKHMQKK